MKEAKANIVSDNIISIADAICFTSNGIVKANGELVMGAGIAKVFRDKWPSLAKFFGTSVNKHGNHVHTWLIPLGNRSCYVCSFPTKNHWKNPSDLKLIEQSAKELVVRANEIGLKHVFLTRPGCGLGGLSWERQVKPLIEKILDDRFMVLYL